jgi:hypothetical protein
MFIVQATALPSLSTEHICFYVWFSFKAHLHFGDYRSKLVHFEGQKIFYTVKKDLALSDLRHSVKTTNIANVNDPLDNFLVFI